MIKDKFTKRELFEFFVGIIFTLFLSYSVIEKMNKQINQTGGWHGIILFIFTITACVGFLWLQKIDKWGRRLLSAVMLSIIIIPLYFFGVFGIFIFSLEYLQMFLVALCVSVIGALTIDILRED